MEQKKSVAVSNISFAIMAVTPELAREWIETTNTHNRRINPNLVDRIAGDIKKGNWELTHQGIAFDKDGVLIDGQHRIMAIAKSGKTVRVVVSFGWDRKTQLSVDQNMPRSAAGQITLLDSMGVVTDTEISILRAMVKRTRSGKLSISDECVGLKAYRDAIRFAMKNIPGNVRGVSNAVTMAVIARAYYTCDLPKLERFCRILSSGISECPQDQPAVILWKYLVGGFISSSDRRQQRFGKTERALEAYMKGELLTKLYVPTKELFPLPDEDLSSLDGEVNHG